MDIITDKKIEYGAEKAHFRCLTTEQSGLKLDMLLDVDRAYQKFGHPLVAFVRNAHDHDVPAIVNLKVTETSPGIKGASNNQTKDATTETGLTLRVPQFIDEGELIAVSTVDGKYSSRA